MRAKTPPDDTAILHGLLALLREIRPTPGKPLEAGPGRLFHMLRDRGFIVDTGLNTVARTNVWRGALRRIALELAQRNVHAQQWRRPGAQGCNAWRICCLPGAILDGPTPVGGRVVDPRWRHDRRLTQVADSRLTRRERRALNRGLPIEPEVVYINQEFADPDEPARTAPPTIRKARVRRATVARSFEAGEEIPPELMERLEPFY